MEETIHDRLKSLAVFLAEYATSLLSSGVHTSRIVRNSKRIADSFGYQMHITLLQKSVIITVRTNDNEHSYSIVSGIKPMPISFELNSDLSALSWDAYDRHLDIDKLWEGYRKALSKPKLNFWIIWLLVSLANAAFCRLFGGDIAACIAVFAATAVGFGIRQILLKKHVNHYYIWFLSAFCAALCTSPMFFFGWGNTPHIAMGTSVLFLVPGVPLINGIIDIVEGHVLSGTARLINAMLLITCLSMGLLCALMITGGNVQ